MNEMDMAELLEHVQAGDNRILTDSVIGVWLSAFARAPWVDLPDAKEAVNIHRAESTDYLLPAHVIANARRVKAERERDRARKAALTAGKPLEARGAPWWFWKLVEAETAEAKRLRAEQGRWEIPPIGIRLGAPVYPGDELTIEEKLAKFKIVQEPGDEERSKVAAQTLVANLPKLGGFLRDPDAKSGYLVTRDFGA